MADEIGTNSAEARQAADAAIKAYEKKKKKKRLIIIGVILAVLIIGIIAGGGSGSGDVQKENGGKSVEAETKSDISTDGKIGDYVCTIKSAVICADWEDKTSVKITYEFTNNSSDAQSFDVALSDELYQNGIGLESTFTGDDDEDLICDVKIQPGTTKDVSKVYVLRDTSTPIDVEISEFISWSDDKLHYTVTLE